MAWITHLLWECVEEFRTYTALRALFMGCLSGTGAAFLRYLDREQGLKFLEEVVPDDIVFNGLIIFAAVVASFRTSHALVRYKAAASYLQRMQAGWYDAASTLFAFSRTSKAASLDVLQFQVVTVRLLSLMNAYCLEKLVLISGEAALLASASRRNEMGGLLVLVPESFDEDFLASLDESDAKPELLLARLDVLMIDAMRKGILNIPAPLLTRSFTEISQAYEVYTEARKMASIPFPFAYILFGYSVLIILATATPFMLAFFAQGVISSFVFTFSANFLLWYVNGIADVLNNPYSRKARLLNAQKSQEALNAQLCQLLANSDTKCPTSTVSDTMMLKGASFGQDGMVRRSLGSWKRQLSSQLGEQQN